MQRDERNHRRFRERIFTHTGDPRLGLPRDRLLRCALMRKRWAIVADNDNVAAIGATNWHDRQITKSLSIPSCKNKPLTPSGKSVTLICASHGI
jgi:hypothetical protein